MISSDPTYSQRRTTDLNLNLEIAAFRHGFALLRHAVSFSIEEEKITRDSSMQNCDASLFLKLYD